MQEKKTADLGSIFIPGKYVLRVCFESPFYEDDIQLEIQVAPGHVVDKKTISKQKCCRLLLIS